VDQDQVEKQEVEKGRARKAVMLKAQGQWGRKMDLRTRLDQVDQQEENQKAFN